MPGRQKYSVVPERGRNTPSRRADPPACRVLGTIPTPHRDRHLKYLMWLLKAAIFFVLFAFALNNQEPVTLHWFFGAYSQAPLVLVLLLTLVIGVVLGVAIMLPLWWKARRARPSLAVKDAKTDAPAAGPSVPQGPTPTAAGVVEAPDIEPPAESHGQRHGV